MFTIGRKSRRGGVHVSYDKGTTSHRRLTGCQPGTELDFEQDPTESIASSTSSERAHYLRAATRARFQ